MDELHFAQTLTPKELETLEDLGSPASFSAGQEIFPEGQSSEHPRVAISLLELVSRRLRESDARRVENG